MTLVAYYVDFFMGNTKKKKTIKIGQEIEILHSIREKPLLAPPQNTGGARSPKINTNLYLEPIINVPKY